MVEKCNAESIRIIGTDGGATVRCVDGTTLQLRKEVLDRSSLLHQTVSEYICDDEVSMGLPQSVVEAWLEGLTVLGVHAGVDEMEPNSHIQTLYFSPRRLLEQVQVRLISIMDRSFRYIEFSTFSACYILCQHLKYAEAFETYMFALHLTRCPVFVLRCVR